MPAPSCKLGISPNTQNLPSIIPLEDSKTLSIMKSGQLYLCVQEKAKQGLLYLHFYNKGENDEEIIYGFMYCDYLFWNCRLP